MTKNIQVIILSIIAYMLFVYGWIFIMDKEAYMWTVSIDALCMIGSFVCTLAIYKRLKTHQLYNDYFWRLVGIMAFGITMEFALETIFSLLSVEHFRIIPYILYMCVYAYIILWINFSQHEKKQMIRFMLDILVVFVTVFALGYQFFIHPLLEEGRIHKVDMIGVIYLLLDIGMLCALFFCFMLKIYKKLSLQIVILLTTAFILQLGMNGVNMYTFFFHNINIWHYVSPIIMITGMLLLLCVEIHVQVEQKQPIKLFLYERIQKMEYIYSYIFYFLCSIALFVAFLHTGEKLTASSISFGVVLMLMLMRQMLIVMEKEELLQNVHQMNGELQELVQERTRKLEVSENRDKSLFQNYPNPTFYLDVKGNILQRNKAAEEISTKKVKNINEFIAEKMMFQKEEDINRVINNVLNGSLETFDFSMYDSGLKITRYFAITSIPIRIKKKLKGMYVILKEITQTIVQEKQIYELAHYDTLTKLANRRTFEEQLAAHIRLANEDKHSVAVMFIDLDRFKIVNDTLGHHVGDELLKEVAQRLLLAVDSKALVARLGGDEFTILFYNFTNEEGLAEISRNILAVFENPIIIQEQVLKVTLSIGVSIHEKGMDGATLMKNADSAMYYVKARGKNNYQIYDEAIAYHYQRQFNIEKDLYKAIEHNQLTLYYQPQYCLRKNEFVGLEALARWQHPSLGIISPADFIPIAEETGLIVNMGEWIIRESCKKMKELRDKGYKVTKMCVNISKKQLEKEGFVESVATIFEEIGIEAMYMEFELTESILLAKEGNFFEKVEDLKRLGISIAIDDFGTGYSSLSYLPNFSFDTLKLARELIEGVEEDSKRATVVDVVLELSHSLGFKTIVEGVETESQLEYFKGKCHYMQGFYLSKPLPQEEVEAFLEEYCLLFK